MFKTIKENVTGEIVEKKSRFIANAFYVESMEEVNEVLKQVKKKYHDARHNCFACIIETGDGEGAVVRFNDDGEPSGTAGAPILNILANMGLSNILVIVTRYFGGTLLGTGGLVKAYTDSTKAALDAAQYVEKDVGEEAVIEVTYDNINNLKYHLDKKNIKILKTEYLENIKVTIEIPKNLVDEFTNSNNINSVNIIKYDKIKEKYIDI